MLASERFAPNRRVFSARRFALVAGVAGLGVLFANPGFAPQSLLPALGSPAHAQSPQRPVGFADIVEKVKPAVISVRVKMDGGPRVMGFGNDNPFPKGSPMAR